MQARDTQTSPDFSIVFKCPLPFQPLILDFWRDGGVKVWRWTNWPEWTSSTVAPAWSELSSGTPTPRLALASGMTWPTHMDAQHSSAEHKNHLRLYHLITVRRKKQCSSICMCLVILMIHIWQQPNEIVLKCKEFQTSFIQTHCTGWTGPGSWPVSL